MIVEGGPVIMRFRFKRVDKVDVGEQKNGGKGFYGESGIVKWIFM